MKSDQSVEILFRVSGFIMSEEDKKFTETCRDHLAEILANISEAKPNDLSILFAGSTLFWYSSTPVPHTLRIVTKTGRAILHINQKCEVIDI